LKLYLVAKYCTFLELNKQVAQQLQINLNTLKIDNAQIIQSDSLQYLSKQATRQYDIVFIDPPFNQGLAQPCIDQLEAQGYLLNGSLIYVEIESTLLSISVPNHWSLLKEKISGQVRYQLFRRE
jgi:16S rRNA (guanine966-N2)-methyltransferase